MVSEQQNGLSASAGPASSSSIPPDIRICKDKYAGQIVVVTESAQGIGRGTAELFSAQGAVVVLIDVQEKKLKAVQAKIEQDGGKAAFRACDLTIEHEVISTFEWIISQYSRIDVLAHLAGIYPFHPLVDYPTKMYLRIMAVNMDATFFVVRAALPLMQKHSYGRIILTTSTTFAKPAPGLSMYLASKGGVIGLMRAAAVEAGPGVTVNAVMPGLIHTETSWNVSVQPDGTNPIFEHEICGQIIKRAGMPEDVAHAISYLASPEASFITGQISNVDAGGTFY